MQLLHVGVPTSIIIILITFITTTFFSLRPGRPSAGATVMQVYRVLLVLRSGGARVVESVSTDGRRRQVLNYDILGVLRVINQLL